MLSPSIAIKSILIASILLFTGHLSAQQNDSTKQILNVSGAINANSNGFSLVPTFSLGKPAVQSGFNINANGRLSFHPQVWYSMLDYKPWSFIFIWRYKLIDKEKLQFLLGTHAPGINFQSATVVENSIQKDVIKARRFYPALELSLIHHFRKNITFGMYSIVGRGIEEEISATNTFISFRIGFINIPISNKLYLQFNPQIYYLNIDKIDGFYVAGGLVLAHRNSPISFTTMMNRELISQINVSKFEWNVGITYAFAKGFVER